MNHSKQKITLILLAFIFIVPGIAAMVFYNHPNWLVARTLNKGSLINPPFLFKHFNPNKKWRLIYLNDGECENQCLEQMDKLARIRLALGRQLYQVDQYLVIKNNQHFLPTQVQETFKKNQISIVSQHGNSLNPLLTTRNSAIFIANPEQYLILMYQIDASSDDIYHDLKQLLTMGKKSV